MAEIVSTQRSIASHSAIGVGAWGREVAKLRIFGALHSSTQRARRSLRVICLSILSHSGVRAKTPLREKTPLLCLSIAPTAPFEQMSKRPGEASRPPGLNELFGGGSDSDGDNVEPEPKRREAAAGSVLCGRHGKCGALAAFARRVELSLLNMLS